MGCASSAQVKHHFFNFYHYFTFWEIKVKPSKKGKKKGKEEGAEEAAEEEAVPAPEVEVGEDGVSRPVSARPEVAEAVMVETGKERKRRN